MAPYASNVPAPILKREAPSESVPPTWFIVSLVTWPGQGCAPVQRKPAENHSVTNCTRNWPGSPVSACWGRRRPVPPVSVFDSLTLRSRRAHSAATAASSPSAASSPAAGAAGAAPPGGAGGGGGGGG